MTVRTFDLNAVRVARENPRTSRSDESIKKMAASLLAIGLLHSLVGYEENGTAQITAGGTRVLAIKSLLADGKITAEHDLVTAIAVNIKDKSQAIDTGLTSNLMQSIMSMPDQFKAYSDLHHVEGVSIEEIAERYFTDVAQVKRILKLANLAAPIFQAFNDEKISLQIAKVYAGCSDQDKQLRAWKECGVNGNISAVRRILREDSYKSTAATVEWITLKAYEEAGGRTELDLFEDETVLVDGTIVEELFAQKCTDYAEALEAKGWGQVTYFEDSQSMWNTASTLNNQLKPTWKPNKRDKAAYEKQEGILETIEENHGSWQYGWSERVKKQAKKARAKMDKIEERANVYSANQMKNGHVLWTFGSDGVTTRFMSAKLKPTEKPKKGTDAPKADVHFSNSFMEQVRRTSGNALMCHLTRNPSKLCRALAVMAIDGTFDGVDVQGRNVRAMKYAHDLELPEMETRQPLRSYNSEERLAVLMDMSEAELDAEIAYALLPRYEIGYGGTSQMELYKAIAERSEFDLASVWQMDGEEISALNKKQLLRVVETLGRSVGALEGCKKSELVIIVSRYVEEQRWTPEFVRTHEPTAKGEIEAVVESGESDDEMSDAIKAQEQADAENGDATGSPDVAAS